MIVRNKRPRIRDFDYLRKEDPCACSYTKRTQLLFVVDALACAFEDAWNLYDISLGRLFKCALGQENQ